MSFSWLWFKKPDASMTMNGALAGLVAITAPCAVVSPGAAVVIGLIAGVLVVLSVEFFDKVLHIDDPVGAVSVHMVNGVFGTLAVGIWGNVEVWLLAYCTVVAGISSVFRPWVLRRLVYGPVL